MCAWRGRPAPAADDPLAIDCSAELDEPVHNLGVGVDGVPPFLLAGFELAGVVGKPGLLFAQVTSVGL